MDSMLDTRGKFAVPEAYPDWVYERIATDLPFTSGEQLLDAGCGTGEITRALAAKFAFTRVLGVDRDEYAIAQAKANHVPRAEFELEELKSVRSKKRFLCVTAFNAFHEFADDREVMGNLIDLLAVDGCFFVVNKRLLADSCPPFAEAVRQYCEPGRLRALANACEVKGALKACGLHSYSYARGYKERWSKEDALARLQSFFEWQAIPEGKQEEAAKVLERKLHEIAWDGGYADIATSITLTVARLLR